MSQPILNTVLGAANFGETADTPTIKDPAAVQQLLDVWKRNGFSQVDTSRQYGTSEEMLGSLNYQEQGILVDTKILSFFPQAHSANNIRASIKKSLEGLKVEKVRFSFLFLLLL